MLYKYLQSSPYKHCPDNFRSDERRTNDSERQWSGSPQDTLQACSCTAGTGPANVIVVRAGLLPSGLRELFGRVMKFLRSPAAIAQERSRGHSRLVRSNRSKSLHVVGNLQGFKAKVSGSDIHHCRILLHCDQERSVALVFCLSQTKYCRRSTRSLRHNHSIHIICPNVTSRWWHSHGRCRFILLRNIHGVGAPLEILQFSEGKPLTRLHSFEEPAAIGVNFPMTWNQLWRLRQASQDAGEKRKSQLFGRRSWRQVSVQGQRWQRWRVRTGHT
mmetsp:Transcript_11468/g.70481  ORF Transcript_11468/g.70481 Transcript_11468/m.70481 type:complete len:273 (-) Transcript_11468:2033-2851(-)